MKLEEAYARRIVCAVLANIDNWRERALEIEQNANVGNKARALSLARDLEMVKHSLRRLADVKPGECE